MRTNVTNLSGSSRIPAGIFHGTEIFSQGGEMFALYQGKRMHFTELPSMEKRNFIDLYLSDKEGQRFIRDQFGITGFESGFKKWLFCKFGSLDGNPDMVDSHITPDTYNSACHKTDCPGRGRFCGQASGIKSHEVATLRKLIEGKTASEIADELHISLAAVKSRLESLKLKFNAPNSKALAACAAEIGIIPI